MWWQRGERKEVSSTASVMKCMASVLYERLCGPASTQTIDGQPSKDTV